MMGAMKQQEPRRGGAPTGPHSSDELGHGSSVAMWSASGLGILAGVIATYAAIRPSVLPWVLAAVVALLAIVSLVVLNKMGFGQYSHAEADSAEDSPTVGIS